MSDLDEKLLSILRDFTWRDGSGRIDADGALSEVKQAFIDAGWITPEQVKKTQGLVNQMANLAKDMSKQPVMVWNDPGKLSELKTGQEWFDRFERELPNTIFPTWYERNKPDEAHEVLDRELVLEIAKKAAGIE